MDTIRTLEAPTTTLTWHGLLPLQSNRSSLGQYLGMYQKKYIYIYIYIAGDRERRTILSFFT